MLQLRKIDDPRDAYAKLRRKECETLMKENGLEWAPSMPALLMQRMLRASHAPLPDQVRRRTLGEPVNGGPGPDVEVEKPDETDALAHLQNEWKRDNLESMAMSDLRAKAKELGVALSRTDKKPDIIAKIRHGEDAS